MLTIDLARDLVHGENLSRTEILLLLVLINDAMPKSATNIRKLAISSGIRKAANWNFARDLNNCKPYIVKVTEGYVITAKGREYLTAKQLIPQTKRLSAVNVLNDLRNHAAGITNQQTRSFVEEAISCLEFGLYRPAVVFSWMGAVSILHEHVFNQNLAQFNSEAKRRNPKWNDATTTDELSNLKENDFLDVIEKIAVIGGNVKSELKQCLQLRNGCGHPNSLVIGENRAIAHVEVLLLNVFSKF
ncbi:MAG: hypothetical protein R3E39_12085 [Anaerolineae bacterium]